MSAKNNVVSLDDYRKKKQVLIQRQASGPVQDQTKMLIESLKKFVDIYRTQMAPAR